MPRRPWVPQLHIDELDRNLVTRPWRMNVDDDAEEEPQEGQERPQASSSSSGHRNPVQATSSKSMAKPKFPMKELKRHLGALMAASAAQEGEAVREEYTVLKIPESWSFWLLVLLFAWSITLAFYCGFKCGSICGRAPKTSRSVEKEKDDDESVPLSPMTRTMQVQSMCTYTSLRGSAKPQFSLLGAAYTGAWDRSDSPVMDWEITLSPSVVMRPRRSARIAARRTPCADGAWEKIEIED